MSRSRNFCFTWNNYTDGDKSVLTELKCRYIVYGEEVAPTTGTPHLQGFVVFANQATLSSVCKKLKGAHIEIMKGTIDQSEVYCRKEGSVYERGEKPMTQEKKGQVEKDRWADACKAAEEGRFEDIDRELWTKYQNSYRKMRKQFKPACLEGELTNEWWYGPPGSGKTSKAFKDYPDAYLKDTTKWWDEYNHEDVVIIDDMDPFHKSLAKEFKLWAHHAPFVAECKGGSMCIRPKKVIVTSNYSINEVWEDSITQAAMHRRYKETHIQGSVPNYPMFTPGFNPNPKKRNREE